MKKFELNGTARVATDSRLVTTGAIVEAKTLDDLLINLASRNNWYTVRGTAYTFQVQSIVEITDDEADEAHDDKEWHERTTEFEL